MTEVRRETAAMIEHLEAAAWSDLQRSLPAELVRQLGVEVRPLGRAVSLLAPGTETLAINRVIGLGFDEPLTEDLLDDVIDSYTGAGVHRFLIQWSPAALPAHAATLLAARGFKAVSHWAKLWRLLNVPVATQPAHTTLTVTEIGADDAVRFEDIVAQPLGVPPMLGAGVRSTIGKPGWRYYLALDRDRPVAGAASYCNGGGAWFGLAATQERDRCRGAQTALLVRRLADAAADGCRWASADTMTESPTRPNPSYRNMIRLGFSNMYDRPNYVGPAARESA